MGVTLCVCVIHTSCSCAFQLITIHNNIYNKDYMQNNFRNITKVNYIMSIKKVQYYRNHIICGVETC